MPKDYHDQVKNLAVGDVIKVDRRFGFPKVVKLFKQFGYEYEEIVKPAATWAKNVRRTA
tara:strand:+ start:541 stop:717 length:177 start_codon:yes stop_codon:yes gene_type:complete